MKAPGYPLDQEVTRERVANMLLRSGGHPTIMAIAVCAWLSTRVDTKSAEEMLMHACEHLAEDFDREIQRRANGAELA